MAIKLNRINANSSNIILTEIIKTEDSVPNIIVRLNLNKESEALTLKNICVEIIKRYPDLVSKYKSGKNVIGAFIGEAIKEIHGDPIILQKIFKELLEEIE
jgi:Asp-tRNA(Asn)/Glu-tRNA(Gln) amidotransferase B subunit